MFSQTLCSYCLAKMLCVVLCAVLKCTNVCDQAVFYPAAPCSRPDMVASGLPIALLL